MASRRSSLDDYDRRILRAAQLLEARLDEAIGPAELARAANFSLHHFHRIFRARLGETVMQHVRRLRLERAARKIRTPEGASILSLALEAGYESHEAFTRAFAARFGTTPSLFRETPSARVAAHVRKSDDTPHARVTVETYPAIRVAFMRHRGDYATIHPFWERMRAWAASHDLLVGDAPLYGVCPDDPEVTAAEHLRFDGCVVVGETFALAARDGTSDAVAIATLPAGTYAVGHHVGPFDRLADTYLDVIGRWFPTSGYELAADAVIEHYLDDPRVVPAAELRTEVRVRIAD